MLPVFNANGVAASSPGLRGTRYPGNRSQNDNQPQRGCGLTERGVGLSTMEAGTALRFSDMCVFGSQGRPYGIRPTLGWRTQRRWRNDAARPDESPR